MRAELKQARAGVSGIEAEATGLRDRLVVDRKPVASMEVNESSESEEEEEEPSASSSEQDGEGGEVAEEAGSFTALSAADFRRPPEFTGPTAQELLRRPRVQPGQAAVHVAVQRTPEIQAVRLALPIMKEESRVSTAGVASFAHACVYAGFAPVRAC